MEHRPAPSGAWCWFVWAVSVSALSLVGACTAASGGVAPAGDFTKPLRVAVSIDALTEIRRAELDSIQARARVLNIVTQPVVANGSPQQQHDQIHELLATGHVDALIAIAADPDAIVPSIREAQRAGVPFIAVDRPLAPGAAVDFQVVGDPIADGRSAGGFLLAMGRPLQTLQITGPSGDSAATGRRDGFRQALAGAGGGGGWTRGGGG